jgi:hypothetical protein
MAIVERSAPSISVPEALAICGSLSEPSKMPGHGYSLPAGKCRLGRFLRQFPNAVCAHCYALRGRYAFPVVRNAMAKRLSSLSDSRWSDAMSRLICNTRERYFRWHDSGDIQSLEHLRKIFAVCRSLPNVKFWLPTREYQTVEACRRMGEAIPQNLCIRYSAHLINGPPPVQYGLPVSTVSSQPSKSPHGAYLCPADRHGNKCGSCRACWNPQIKVIDFPLKWPSADPSQKPGSSSLT